MEQKTLIKHMKFNFLVVNCRICKIEYDCASGSTEYISNVCPLR